MKYIEIKDYCCPECRGELSVFRECNSSVDRIMEGQLQCKSCEAKYTVSNSIPRFVPEKNYADSFGIEWLRFARTQLDENWQRIYRDRFFRTTEFPESMKGESILEAGCGAGSFTGIALETGAKVYSFDLSNAVDACWQNHSDKGYDVTWSVSQADINHIPFRPGFFDRVFCLGVLQHCPDPEEAFLNLARYLKPGGTIAVDCYLKTPLHKSEMLHLVKHSLRGATKYMPPMLLYKLVYSTITAAYHTKSAVSRVPLVGDILQRGFPIGELNRFDWTAKEMIDIKAHGVFDMLSPRYDNPRTIDEVIGWVEKSKLELDKCDVGYNGVNARARRNQNSVDDAKPSV